MSRHYLPFVYCIEFNRVGPLARRNMTLKLLFDLSLRIGLQRALRANLFSRQIRSHREFQTR